MTLIDEMRGLVTNARSLRALDNLYEVLRLLEEDDVLRYVSLDLGMLQSLNYYTGIIFKGFTYGIGFPLLSGGRYDKVVGEFGRQLSSTGFSLWINFVMTALLRQKKDSVPVRTGSRRRVRQRFKGGGFCPMSRNRGKKKVSTELDCMNLRPDELLLYAKDKGIRRAVFIDAEGGLQELAAQG